MADTLTVDATPQVGQLTDQVEVTASASSVDQTCLIKNARLAKSAVLQLRLEAYNVLNRANFAGPDTTVNNSAAGTITAINGLPRQLQLAAKLSF